MAEHKISLVIPAYNEEKYIGECLDSVFDNSNNLLSEIIVVDNASTDNTKLIAEKRKNVKVICELEKGVMKARQRGYLESTGDIVVFLDADTKMTKGWLDNIVKVFDEDEDISCISGPYIYYDLPKYVQYLAKVYTYVLIMPAYWVMGYMSIFGNFAIRREVLEKMNGLDVSIDFYGDDVNTARRASKFGKVKFIPDHCVYSSGRRIMYQGMVDISKEYITNFLSEAILHKPFSTKHKDFR